ncbi:MAG TPA: PfkB family carbohydrate kinase [Verrucomicrobiae bacterium]|nr:PfkB family carbohydrate kinase [Verrucomicrobiae bacterium]
MRNTQTTTRFRWFVWRDNHYRFEYRINKEPIPYAALDVPASQTPFAHAEQTAMQLFAQAPNQDWLRRQLSLADAVLINDTQKGFLSPDLVDQIGIMIREENRSRQNQGKSNLFTLVDPKNDWDKFSNVPVTLIKSNQHEACHSVSFTDIQFADDESFDLSHADKHSLIKLGKQLHSRFQNYFPHLIVTLGKKGAIKIEHRQGRPVFEYFPGVPPVHQATFDTTHCGDMFATALLASQLLGEPLKDSLAFANYVGSLQYSMALRKKVALENILEQRNLEHLERNYKQAIPWETEDRKVMSEILAFVDARREVAFGGAAILLSRTQYATLWVLATNCNRNKPVRGHKDLASGLVEKLHEMEKEPLAAADLSRRERKTPGPINRLQSTEDGVSNQASRNVLSDLRKRLSELAPANAAARRLLSKLPKGKVLLNLAESQIQFG